MSTQPSDAREHPLVHDNLAIPDLNVIAYLGMPITISDGSALGSFCVIDSKPRQWTPHEIEIMQELANSVMVEIELRAELLARYETEQRLKRVMALAHTTIQSTINAVERQAERSEILTYLAMADQNLESI